METISTVKKILWNNRKSILTVLGGVVTVTVGYGIKLSLTSPPAINPKDIEKEGGKYITTSDGRIVEYFVHGSTKQDASVFIEIAGGMSTGKFLATKIKGLTEYFVENNMRGITITLPGWGYSSCHPARKYKDWPLTDLGPILQAENVEKFAISGISLGTPHAMSAAYHYGDRVTALGLRVPFLGLPLSKEEGLGRGQPSLPTHVVCGTGGRGTWLYSWSIHLLFWLLYQMTSRPYIIQYAIPSRLRKEYPQLSQDALDDLIRAQKWSGYHGIMQCLAYDTILEWGFDIRKLKGVAKVVVWYSSDDDDCPPSHGKWIGEYFEKKEDVQVNVRVFDGYGHMGGLLDHLNYVKIVMT